MSESSLEKAAVREVEFALPVGQAIKPLSLVVGLLPENIIDREGNALFRYGLELDGS